MGVLVCFQVKNFDRVTFFCGFQGIDVLRDQTTAKLPNMFKLVANTSQPLRAIQKPRLPTQLSQQKRDL